MSTISEASSGSSRLHREDWLAHALETLRKEGVTGLRVEPLARSLGVTTGSFYWHFKDRQDLLDSVLAHWTDSMTRAIALRMTSEDEPEAQMKDLLEDVTRRERDRYEIAIRNWGTFDTKAGRTVRTVDECRMAYVKGLFLQLGFSEDQAQIRSRMLIFYQLGEAGFSIKDSLERRLRLAKLRLHILTTDC